MKTKFTKDLIPTGKYQEKQEFTLKPRLKKLLTWRKRGPKQELLRSVEVVDVIKNMSLEEKEKD